MPVCTPLYILCIPKNSFVHPLCIPQKFLRIPLYPCVSQGRKDDQTTVRLLVRLGYNESKAGDTLDVWCKGCALQFYFFPQDVFAYPGLTGYT